MDMIDSQDELLVSTAPVRIDAGGPTDVPQILERGELEGFIFNAAITPQASVAIKPRMDRSIILNSVDYKRSETYANLEELQASNKLDLLKAAVFSITPTHGFELTARIGLPPGSGLGASAAIAVAALSALYMLQNGPNHSIDPETVAKEAIRLESDYLGNIGGSQDQYAAAMGGFNSFFYQDNKIERVQLLINSDIIKALEDQLVIVYSGVSRFSGQLQERVISACKSGNLKARQILQHIASLAKEMTTAVIHGDIILFGKLAADIWEAQSSLTEGITTKEIKQILQLAKQRGAIGGKALGAGGGGCVLIVCPEGRKEEFITLLGERFLIIPFRFSKLGVQTDHTRRLYE